MHCAARCTMKHYTCHSQQARMASLTSGRGPAKAQAGKTSQAASLPLGRRHCPNTHRVALRRGAAPSALSSSSLTNGPRPGRRGRDRYLPPSSPAARRPDATTSARPRQKTRAPFQAGACARAAGRCRCTGAPRPGACQGLCLFGAATHQQGGRRRRRALPAAAAAAAGRAAPPARPTVVEDVSACAARAPHAAWCAMWERA